MDEHTKSYIIGIIIFILLLIIQLYSNLRPEKPIMFCNSENSICDEQKSVLNSSDYYFVECSTLNPNTQFWSCMFYTDGSNPAWLYPTGIVRDEFIDQMELKRRSGMSCQKKNNINTKC